MGTFINILERIRNFYDDDDYGLNLIKFFGTLKKFNYNQSIDLKLKTEIEQYFKYRWNNDHNYVCRGENYSLDIFNQLRDRI